MPSSFGPVSDPETFDRESQLIVGAVPPVGIVLEVFLVHERRQGIIATTEPAGVLARAEVLPGLLKPSQRVGKHGVARQVAGRLLMRLLGQILDDRTHRRPILRGRVEAAADRDLPHPTGLHVVPRPTVVVVGMRHASHHAELVGDPGQLGQVLADQEPRSARSDGSERTANPLGGFRFEVEGLELARTAEEEQEDH